MNISKETCKTQTRSVCTFSALTSMLNKCGDGYKEYETFFLAKGYILFMEQNDGVPLLRLNLEHYIKCIDETTKGISILQKYKGWDMFIKAVDQVITMNRPIVLYLFTGELRYSPVYQKYRSGKHCIVLKKIEDNKCLIEDRHIRDGCKLEEFIGWIDVQEIRDQIISYAYQVECGKKIVSKKELIKSIKNSLMDNVFVMEEYLDTVVYSLEKSINFENDCIENYVHMNIFSGLHYWCYLYDYINSIHLNGGVEELLSIIGDQIRNWDLCKVSILKYMYSKNIALVLKSIYAIKKCNEDIREAMQYIKGLSGEDGE